MIYVIGSGPAGISAAVTLVEAGLPVILLDGGLTLEPEREQAIRRLEQQLPEQWDPAVIASFHERVVSDAKGIQIKYLYGSDFPYQEVDTLIPRTAENIGHLTPTLARGGFSNVWGSAVLPYRHAEMRDWPISAEDLAPAYDSVLSFMEITGAHDDLERFFPLHTTRLQELQLSQQAKDLLCDLEGNRHELRRRGMHFGQARLAVRASCKHAPEGSLLDPKTHGCAYCGLCLYGCPYRLIFSSDHTLRRLQQFPNFSYQPGILVEQLSEETGQALIYARSRGRGESLVFAAQTVFLAAGVLASTKILLESLAAYDHTLELKVSEYFMLPLLRFHKTKGVTQERLHTLAQLFLECFDPSISEHSVHMQVYGYNDLYQQALTWMLEFLGPLQGWVQNELLGRMLVMQGYLHSDLSSRIELTLERGEPGRLRLSGKTNPKARRAIHQIMRKLLFAMPYTHIAPVLPMLQIGSPGEGRHAGGSFPMRTHPGPFESDTLGRPTGFTHVHVVDASVFPSIPASTITFTVMANAQRIAAAIVANA